MCESVSLPQVCSWTWAVRKAKARKAAAGCEGKGLSHESVESGRELLVSGSKI